MTFCHAADVWQADAPALLVAVFRRLRPAKDLEQAFDLVGRPSYSWALMPIGVPCAPYLIALLVRFSRVRLIASRSYHPLTDTPRTLKRGPWTSDACSVVSYMTSMMSKFDGCF